VVGDDINRAMKILLTGGTGFFGKAIIRYWGGVPAAELPERITILTRDPRAFLSRFGSGLSGLPLDLHRGDILAPESLPKGAYTHVLHAATDSTLGPQLSPLERLTQIVDGTKNILDYAVQNNSPRVLLTSSGGVYGPQPEHLERIPETYCGMPDPMVAGNAYGVGKRIAENLCAIYSAKHGLEVVVARCFSFVGQDLPLNVHFAIGNFIRDALYRDQITVHGNGLPIRSYLHQWDLAHWLLTLLQDGRSGAAYNVGSDQAITIAALAECVRSIAAPAKRVVISDLGNDGNWKNRYVPDVNLVRTELGLRVTISLPEAIKRTVAQLRCTPAVPI
jgi:dTDP-glucose 4,6-dehydratase